jgi:hypothetical protein
MQLKAIDLHAELFLTAKIHLDKAKTLIFHGCRRRQIKSVTIELY